MKYFRLKFIGELALIFLLPAFFYFAAQYYFPGLFNNEVFISLITGALLYFYLTFFPHYNKKILYREYKKQYFVKLDLYLGIFIKNVFFLSEKSNRKVFLGYWFQDLENDRDMKKFFQKNSITIENFLNFFEELNQPKISRKNTNVVDEFNSIIIKNNIIPKSPISKDKFKDIIKNISSSSKAGGCEYSAGDAMLQAFENINDKIDKISRDKDFLSLKEMDLMLRLENLKLFKRFFGAERIINIKMNFGFILFCDECYDFYLTWFELHKMVMNYGSSEYQYLSNK